MTTSTLATAATSTTAPALPNSPEYLAALVAEGRIPLRRVLGMLALRSGLTFALLLLLALAFQVAGRTSPVSASAAWWLWFVTAANVACILLMARFGRAEGLRLRDIYFLSGATWKGDLLWTLIAFAGIALFAMPPGTLLAQAFWGDANYPNTMLFRPLPLAAVYPLFLLMPVTQALAELPTYWGYVAPRLRAVGMNRWGVILLVGFVLSVQHMFFAFQLDLRYDLWLAFKFLLFAIWTGIIIDRRPTALPYLMAAHLLLDATLPYFVLVAK
jgi:hypothetical protein